jgi:recombinational DNA repair protein (RecF pathway)
LSSSAAPASSSPGRATRGTHARYAVELLDRFFAEGEGGQAMFDLLDQTLTWLCTDDDLDLVARFYEQHLLGLAGFRPELFACVGEHGEEGSLRPREPAAEDRSDRPGCLPYGFDPEHGGALCPDCYEARKRRPEVAALSPKGLSFCRVH